MPLTIDITTTLLYYDIFGYPLRDSEVYTFLPSNSIEEKEVGAAMRALARDGVLHEHDGYFSVRANVRELSVRRRRMERYAARHWRIARVMTRIIKRFPYIRCVLVTGTLGKNLSAPELDIDFFIITRPHRLWIARTLLILFKKTVLFNSKKYFCLNYFITEDSLEIRHRNIFTATEIAHAKSLYNSHALEAFVRANGWIRDFFPNWSPDRMPGIRTNNRSSLVARLIGALLPERFGDRIDQRLMHAWKATWKRRYPGLSEERRDLLFASTPTESKAHEPDFQTRILDAYDERCRSFLPKLAEHAMHDGQNSRRA